MNRTDQALPVPARTQIAAGMGLFAAAIRLAWPATVLGLAVFVGLQCSRIAFWLEVRHEQRADTVHSMSPSELARYGDWFLRARDAWLYEQHPMSWRGAWMRMWGESATEARATLLIGLGASSITCVALGMVLALRVSQSRIVPYQLALHLRCEASALAMRMAAPWSILAAVAIAGGCWYAGYDRSGTVRSLLDGLLPTRVQAAVMFAAWVVVAAAICVVFVRPGVGRLAPATALLVCSRCRYSRQGLEGRDCPECGSCDSPGLLELPSAASVHRTTLRAVTRGLSLLALAMTGTAVASRAASDWLRLRPPETRGVWSMAHTLGLAPLRLNTIYGEVTVSARPDSRNPTDSWVIDWTLEPNATSQGMETKASFIVSPNATTGKSTVVVRETPCGPLWFLSRSGEPGLQLGVPEVIVKY